MQSEFIYRGRIISKKVDYDGFTFDSEMECEFYKVLKKKEKEGLIFELKRQVPFEVLPEFSVNGKIRKAVNYVADFTFKDKTNKLHVIDVKGMLTDEFLLKRKMFEYKYDLPIEIIVYDSTSKAWFTYEEREALKKERKKNKATKLKEAKKELENLNKKRNKFAKLDLKLKTTGKLTPKENVSYFTLKEELLNGKKWG